MPSCILSQATQDGTKGFLEKSSYLSLSYCKDSIFFLLMQTTKPPILDLRAIFEDKRSTIRDKRSYFLSQNRKLSKLQEQLLCTRIHKFHCCLGIFSSSFNFQDCTYAKTLMLYLCPFTQA